MIKSIEKSNSESLVKELLLSKKELISSKKIMDKKDGHIYPVKDIPFEISENWQWVFLSDISIIQEGPGIRKHQYQDEGIQFITVTNILEGSVDLLKSQKYISLKEYEEKYKHYTINKGDIVTACSGATWGKSAIYENDIPLMLNTSTLRLRFFNDLGDNKYLYYLTKSNYFKSNLALHLTGQQPNYGYSHYSKIPVPIPPLQEQQQIVAILNQAFEAIDQAKANIEKNIANAKELFQSKLNAIFSQKGDGWEEDKLKNITTKIGSGATPRGGQAAYKESGISLIRSMNVHDAGFTSKKLAFIDNEQAAKLNNVIIEENDVLLNITGASVARCCLAVKEFIPARVNQHVSIIRPVKDKIDSNYLHFLLTSKKNKDLLLGIGEQGSTRQAITKVQIENFVVSYPKSIEEQKSLIAEVTTVKTKSKKIIKIYQDKLNNLEDLKKSILQKAFAGELTSPERTK